MGFKEGGWYSVICIPEVRVMKSERAVVDTI